MGQGAAQLDDKLERAALRAADVINNPEPSAAVADVAKRVAGGVDAVGGWLAGPGSPGYRRAGSRIRRDATGEVVEAREGAGVLQPGAKPDPLAPPAAAAVMPRVAEAATAHTAPPVETAAAQAPKGKAVGG